MEWKPKWVALPILDFSRKVYSFEKQPEKGWEWILEFTKSLMLGTAESSCELANSIILDSIAKFTKKSEAGRKGGIASGKARARTSQQPNLPSKEQIYDFAAEQGLDETVAREWYEMTITDRGGLDRNGDPIVNWKGACKRFCTARAKARNKNGENQ